MFSFGKRSRVYVKRYHAEDGSASGALLSFNGSIKDRLLAQFRANYSIEGHHIRGGGAISPKSMLALIGSGGGAIGLSGVMSGSLFMATANPASLMTIGSGVGSAVMGGGAIVGQAPFIAVAGALMPVVAPLVAFQALSTIMVMSQFKGIHTKLDRIEKSIQRIIQRSEATFIGETLSACNRIDDIEAEFGLCTGFTPEMAIRLALVEDKVNPIFERYRCLYGMQEIARHTPAEDIRFKHSDAQFALVLSILDLRIDVLRLKLAIQEDAGYMVHSAKNLVQKSEQYKAFWEDVARMPEQVRGVADQLRDAVAEMNWWQRALPKWVAGKREQRKVAEETSLQRDAHADAIETQLARDLEIARKTKEQLDKAQLAKHMNLIYWRDESGEHSYYTDDLDVG